MEPEVEMEPGVEMEPEVEPEYPASLVGVQTALEEVSTTTVAIETCLLPNGGSCVITATTPTGRTGEREHHTGVRGMREEARPGGGEVDPDHVLAVVTACWRSCRAE